MTRHTIGLFGLALVLATGGIGSTLQANQGDKTTTDPLKIRVSPALSMEPGIVQVTVTVADNPDNRALAVKIDAEAYYSSSAMELDGDRGPATKVFAYRSLPSGQYNVTVTLKNRHGRVLTAEHNFRVIGRADGGAEK
jgi:hypothetical protein